MLYAILKPIVKAALHLYFGRIVLNGMERIDNGRPTLILANHTASFMDAVITACFVKRRIHFFTRGDVFKHKWAGKVMRSLGMLPVYRMRDGRDKLRLNDSSNDEALNILSQGGAVLIFAEGESNIAKVLKPLKKGPFRLAVAAAATLPEAPLIVPLGINYITPAEAGGDAFLNAGEPICTDKFIEGNDDTTLAKAATAMMRATHIALKDLVWHTICEADLIIADLALGTIAECRKRYAFRHTQRVMRKVNTFQTAQQQKLIALSQRWYSIYRRQPSTGQFLKLLALAPFAALGLAFHWPVIRISRFITARKVDAPDFIAPVFLCCCVLLMISWYLLAFIILELVQPSWEWLPALLLTAFCGILYRRLYWPLFRRPAVARKAIARLTELIRG